MINAINYAYPRLCYLLFGLKWPVFIIFFALSFVVFKLSKKEKKYLRFLVILVPAALIFLRLLFNDYFLSDDFDHFVVVNKFSFSELLIKGLTTNEVWAFHRLFVAFWLFKIIYILFGTNYYAFLAFNFLLHIANLFLFDRILARIKANNFARLLTLFLFSFYYLTWISNMHELIAMTFFLITFNLGLYLVLDKKKFDKKLVAISLITYFLGVSSKEVVFLLPYTLFLFLIFYNNYVKKINLKRSMVLISPLILVSLFYLFFFAGGFSSFSLNPEGSGYKSIVTLSNFASHVSFFIENRLPILANIKYGILLFILGIVLFDIYKKKPILTPLFASYLIVLAPAAVLTKFESYYGYIPSAFFYLTIFVLVNEAINVFKTKKELLVAVFSSLLIVFVFQLNLQTQENCFLLQYSRPLARKVAVERVVNKVETELKEGGKEINIDLEGYITEESNWFLSNRYLPFFLKDKNALNYEYNYLPEELKLEVTKNE